MTHYSKLLDAAPPYALGLPYILHCMVEQIVRTHISDDEAAEMNAETELGSIEAFFASAKTQLVTAPKSAGQVGSEAAKGAAGASALIAYGDKVDARLHAPPPFGVAASGEPSAQHAAERTMLELLPKVTGPSPPVLTEEERGAERTELHHFSKFAPPQVDASMQLRALAAVINTNDVHRGTSNGSGWMLADRPWLEEHTKERMAQLMLDAAATSAPAKTLTTYHARDDVMLVALHRPVPPDREEAAVWSCPLSDRVSRKYGEWHSWLMKKAGRFDEVAFVPPPPIPPTTYDVNVQRAVGATLYKLSDSSKAEILRTSQSLYPSDHCVIQITPSDGTSGFTCAAHFRDGGFAAMRKADGVDETCSFAMTFADGARAAVAPLDNSVEGSAFALSFGGSDSLQLSLSVTGTASMAPPAKAKTEEPPPPSPAATLLLSNMAASGVPTAESRPEGGEVYVRATLVGVSPEAAWGENLSVSSGGVAVESAEESYTFPTGDSSALAVPLPLGTPRPPVVLIELWDTDCEVPGATPLAALELPDTTFDGSSGTIEGVALPATAEGGAEIAFSFKYALEVEPSRKPAPPVAEVCREVTPTGVVLVKYEDGSLKAMLRDGNICERSASAKEPLVDAWISTNSAGLRMGVKDSGEAFYVSAVAVASSTDPVTHHVVTTRSDGTLVISRADGSRLVTFADGTMIDSSAEAVKSAERGDVKVSCEGYPPVTVNLRLKEVEIAGLDGTILKAEMAKEGEGSGVKLHHLDGTVLKASADGTLDLFPAELAWQPGRAADERSGIYRYQLRDGRLSTRDPSGSTFVATVDAGHSIDLVLKDDLAAELEKGNGDEAEDEEIDDDNPDWSHPPRLFVCRPDGSGVELMRGADVRGFMAQRDAEVENGTAMLLREPLPAEPSAESYTFCWKDWMQMHIASLLSEEATSDAQQLLGFMPKIVTPPSDTTSLHFRRLVRRDVLKEREREILEVEIKDMAEYRDTEEQRAKAMHVVDPRTEEEKEAEAALQQEMLKVRTTLCPLFFCTHVYWPAAWGLAGWPLGLGGEAVACGVAPEPTGPVCVSGAHLHCVGIPTRETHSWSDGCGSCLPVRFPPLPADLANDGFHAGRVRRARERAWGLASTRVWGGTGQRGTSVHARVLLAHC